MDISGIISAEDKASLTSLSIGRTTINYSNTQTNTIKDNLNLSQDALNLLNSVGFGYKRRYMIDKRLLTDTIQVQLIDDVDMWGNLHIMEPLQSIL